MDIWVEIVTLLIPGFNDTRDELERLTSFLAGVSQDIPWHVTAFHKDYRMNDPADTTPEMLVAAADIGRRNGLRYVYAGNLPGRVGDFENTRCHCCGTLVVERYGYFIKAYKLTASGACPSCGTSIPGRWGSAFERQITDRPFVPGSRRLRMA
jgi:pyruvate formate lyase activating enzyme